MKKRMSRVVSAVLAFILLMSMTIPAGAEEFFAEESFGAAETFEEESFFEEEFFEDVDEVEEEIGEEEEELESRSILALPTEETKNAVEDWQLAPANFTAVSQKNSTVLLTWVPAVKKLPKNVKYYIYEVDSKTGAALQIGKPLTGKKVTIKNVTGGKHTYLLRAEYVNSKTTEEKYGVFTPKVTVTVNSALWMNKPTLTAVQTDSKTIQVSWSVKEIADSYTLTITRGKGKTATTEIKTVRGTTYTDKKGQTGVANSYQVQPVKGGALGKASAKKSCTLIGEGWKAAPVITSAVQTGVREVTLTWKSGEAAERYIITGGAKATTVLTNALTKNANGEYEYTLPVKKEGKVKLAVQPQGTDAKGKLVKGKKSAVFPVQVKVTSILGVKNVYAVAGDKNITIKWENYNPDASAFEVSVFNGKNVKKTNKVTAQAGKTEYTYVVKDLAVGDYGYYVRTIRTDGMAMHDDEPAIPTVKVVTATVAVIDVSLNKASTTLAVGMTETLTATVTPSNATNKNVIWTSSNTNVATVSNTGVVTAKAAGTAAITATTASGNKTATCTVTVVVPVTGVSLNKTSTTLEAGKTETLKAIVEPSNATNKNVTWTSSDTSVATVTSAGVVKGVKEGKATITVKTVDGAKTATCAVTVVVPVTGVKLNKASTTIAVGKTETLTATVAPGNATNKNVTWTSSNTNVATVSNTGIVTAKAAGSATITVKTVDGAKTATCAVTVVVPVTGVKLNKASTTIAVGKTETLKATVEPSNATNKNVTWTSSNTNIATVTSAGVVKGVKEGKATITVKTADGAKTATCVVTVVVPVTGVKLNKASTTIAVGKTETLKATVEPGNATNKNVTWSSSNTSIATVTNAGVVKGVKAGKATISVKTADGAKTAKCTVEVVNPVKITKQPENFKGPAYAGAEKPTFTVTAENAKSYQWEKKSANGWTKISNATSSTYSEAIATAALAKVKYSGAAYRCAVTGLDGTVIYTKEVKFVILVHQITLDKTEASVNIGKTVKITAKLDAYAESAGENKNINWTSSNTKVATVDKSTGVVTGVAAGTATITATATDGSKTKATCKVTVIPDAVSLSSTSKTGVSPDGTSFTVTVTANGSWTVKSNNAWIKAEKTSDGKGIKLTAEKNDTTTVRTGTVKVTCGKASATFTLTQDKHSVSIKSNVPSSIPASGGTYELTITANGAWSISKNMTWVTLSKTSGSGNATIKATVAKSTEKESRKGIVTVFCGTAKANRSFEQAGETIPITSITLTGDKASINVAVTAGESKTVNIYSILPGEATNKRLKVTSSDESIVKVTNIAVNENTTIPYTSSFTFKGIKTGTATITVAAQDGSGVKATCKVTVSNGAVTTAPSLSGSASGDTISLTWNAVTNATHYDLYFVDQYGTDVKEPIRGIKGTSWSGNGYANGTYYFQVAAVGTTDIQDNWKHSKIVKVIVTGSSVVGYYAAGAVEYAKNNYAGYKDGHTMYPGADCANFVSNCLHYGGHLEYDKEWYDMNSTEYCKDGADSEAWRITTSMLDYFIKNKEKRNVTVYTDGNYKVSYLSPGDIVWCEGDSGYRGHVVLVVSVEGSTFTYCGHTKNQMVSGVKASYIQGIVHFN